jgi:hypothetical protein
MNSGKQTWPKMKVLYACLFLYFKNIFEKI